MDKIELTFSKEINKDDLGKIDFKITWLKESSGNETIEFSGKDLKVESDKKVMTYSVNSDKYELKKYMTSVDKAWHKAEIIQPDPKQDNKTVTVDFSENMEDKMAPVIAEARYLDYAVSGDNKDNLTIVYSESVENKCSSEPFTFIAPDKSDDKAYTVKLSKISFSSTAMGFTVADFVDGNEPVDGDSVWIAVKGDIEDVTGNKQENKKNIKCKIKFSYVYDFSVIVYPNGGTVPRSDMDKAANYYKTDNITTDKDIMILLKPIGVVKNPENFNPKVTLFDGLGNTIIKSESLKFNNENFNKAKQTWYYIWKNRGNQNGRAAGFGTYLGIITIEQQDKNDNDQEYDPIRFMIGTQP
jgi:hypothetical protein